MKKAGERYTIYMRNTKPTFLGISSALFSVALLASSAAAFDFDRGVGSLGDMVNGLKASSADMKAPTVSTASTGGLSAEFAHFWENLKEDTVDGICKQAQIKLNEDGKLAGDALVVGGKFKRYLKKLPSEKVALIDEVGVSVGGSYGHEVANPGGSLPVNVSVSAKAEGTSIVVRPLESDKYCRELDTLVKLYQVKTVLPVNEKRITGMDVGEIWKLPVTLHFGFSVGAGATLSEVLNVSVSAGQSRDSKPSVTLYRMDKDTLRLRLRLDRVMVRSVGVSAGTVEIPMVDLGLIGGENAVSKLLNKEINRQVSKEINEYLAAKLSFGHSKTVGKKLMIEFLLDANDPQQMDNLVKFLRGDFGILKRFIEMGLKFNHFSEEDQASSGVGELAGAATAAGDALGASPSFAGTDIYHGQSNNLHIQVPVIHTHDTTWASSYNRYQSLEKDGETIHVQQNARTSNGSSLNIPFVGKVMKYDSNKNVYVINKESTDGTATRPAFLYQQYEGFVKEGDGTARYMLEKANGVLRYVGVNGNGTDLANTLPSTEIFPPLPSETDADGFETTPSKTYKSAVMSFKLMINERGVQEIIFAPAQAIMKAYMNVMREVESEIVDKVMDLFTIDKEGKVDYDYKAVQKRLGVSAFDNYDNGTNPLDIVRNLAYAATQVIRDISSVKNASNWKDQSERFSKVAAGGGKSGLGYEDFLKVVVQLVNPSDISASVYVHTDKRVKGEADVTQTYEFFNDRDNNFDKTISEVNQMRDRFADPSTLTD